MTQANTESTSKVRTGFTVHSTNSPDIVTTFRNSGDLEIRQGTHFVVVPRQALNRFKTAVSDLKEVN